MINRIRDIRRQKGLTLAEVAARCDPATTAQTIGRLETGMRSLSLTWMNRIAEALEIDPQALAERRLGVQLIDVRESAEFVAALGHIPGARLIPLSSLRAALTGLDRERPVVTVCRSGARSAQACALLQKAGLSRVANLAGGMLRWHASGLPVEESHP